MQDNNTISVFSEDQYDKLLVEKPQVQLSWRNTNLRWLALFFSCTMLMGTYICTDYPQYLQNQIYQDMFNYQTDIDDSKQDPQIVKDASFKYGWLYSIYSFPNMILPLFGGFFIDKLGVRKGCFIFSIILIAGQALCTFSGIFGGSSNFNSTSTYIVMLFGRFIFCLGGENIGVAQSTFASKWFLGKSLAFAMGVTITVARLGSVLGGFVYPILYDQKHNLFLPLFFGTLMCVFSWVMGMCLNYMDQIADQQENKTQLQQIDESEVVSLKDIKSFPLLYWLLTFNCVCNYVCIQVFLQFSGVMLTNQYQVSQSSSSNIITIPYTISSIVTPFAGIIVDKIGQRQYLLLGSSLLLLIIHILWLIFPQCPKPNEICSEYYYFIPLILMGIVYSTYAAVLWPCFPLVLEPKCVGTGFGVAYSFQNFGLAVFPLIVSVIQGNTVKYRGGYEFTSVTFVVISSVSVLLSIIVILDNKKKNILGKTIKLNRSSQINDVRKSSMGAKRSFRN